MASQDARARQGERAAAEDAADPAEPVRTRHVSGWAPKPTLDTSLVLDEDREPEHVADTSEPTLVTPGELIESLRAASRAMESEPFTATESHPSYFEGSAHNEEDTTIFVLHEDGDLHPAWVRKAISIFAGATTLTAILTLLALPTPAPAMPRQVVNHVAPPAPPVQAAPIPTVVQLQPPTPVAEQSEVEKPSAEQVADPAQQELDTERKWIRALERGHARLLAREFDAAVFSFERAIEYHPQDPRAYAGLAEAQRERGKWNEAARAYQEAIALSPEDASLRVALDRVNEQAARVNEQAARVNEQAANDEMAPQAAEPVVEDETGGTE